MSSHAASVRPIYPGSTSKKWCIVDCKRLYGINLLRNIQGLIIHFTTFSIGCCKVIIQLIRLQRYEFLQNCNISMELMICGQNIPLYSKIYFLGQVMHCKSINQAVSLSISYLFAIYERNTLKM